MHVIKQEVGVGDSCSRMPAGRLQPWGFKHGTYQLGVWTPLDCPADMMSIHGADVAQISPTKQCERDAAGGGGWGERERGRLVATSSTLPTPFPTPSPHAVPVGTRPGANGSSFCQRRPDANHCAVGTNCSNSAAAVNTVGMHRCCLALRGVEGVGGARSRARLLFHMCIIRVKLIHTHTHCLYL